jgi:hypothetical protein
MHSGLTRRVGTANGARSEVGCWQDSGTRNATGGRTPVAFRAISHFPSTATRFPSTPKAIHHRASTEPRTASEGSLGPSLGDGAFVQLVEPWGAARRRAMAREDRSFSFAVLCWRGAPCAAVSDCRFDETGLRALVCRLRSGGASPEQINECPCVAKLHLAGEKSSRLIRG